MNTFVRTGVNRVQLTRNKHDFVETISLREIPSKLTSQWSASVFNIHHMEFARRVQNARGRSSGSLTFVHDLAQRPLDLGGALVYLLLLALQGRHLRTHVLTSVQQILQNTKCCNSHMLQPRIAELFPVCLGRSSQPPSEICERHELLPPTSSLASSSDSSSGPSPSLSRSALPPCEPEIRSNRRCRSAHSFANFLVSTLHLAQLDEKKLVLYRALSGSSQDCLKIFPVVLGVRDCWQECFPMESTVCIHLCWANNDTYLA